MPGGTSSERGSIRSTNGAVHVVGVAHEPVRVGLLVALELAGDRGDRAQPLHVRHPVPAGDDQPHRETVLRQQRRAVHLVGEQDVFAERLVDAEAPLVVVLDLALDAAVETGEDEVARRFGDPASSRIGASGVPVHSAVPTASRTHGWLGL